MTEYSSLCTGTDSFRRTVAIVTAFTGEEQSCLAASDTDSKEIDGPCTIQCTIGLRRIRIELLRLMLTTFRTIQALRANQVEIDVKVTRVTDERTVLQRLQIVTLQLPSTGQTYPEAWYGRLHSVQSLRVIKF